MDIIKKVTKDAERLLKSLKAKYYIELPTGEQIWHDLDGYELVPSEPEKPARKKREMRSGQPFGAVTAYFRPYLEKCKSLGDIAEIPFSGYNPDHLRSAIAAHCSAHWGKGTYSSYLNREKKQIEVMRTDASKPKAPRKDKVQGQSKVNGQGAKFHTVGHGLDALKHLEFDDQS